MKGHIEHELIRRASDECRHRQFANGCFQYSAMVLGATENVGGRIVQLLIKNPLCKKVVVVTRRKTDATVKILEYKEMEPFFVEGESDEPRRRPNCS